VLDGRRDRVACGLDVGWARCTCAAARRCGGGTTSASASRRR